MTELITALVSIHGSLTFLSDVHCFFDPSGRPVWFSINHYSLLPVDHVILLSGMVGKCGLVVFCKAGCASTSGITSFYQNSTHSQPYETQVGTYRPCDSRKPWFTGWRLLWSIQNQTGLPGGSKKQCTSERKVNNPWINTTAVINSVKPTTTLLTRQSIVASSLGRTEYQLLVIKISVRDWNVNVNNVFGWVLMNLRHCNLTNQINLFLEIIQVQLKQNL